MLRSQTGAMPTWVKILLAVVVVGIVGVIVLMGFLVNMFKDAASPQQASKVAHEMVQIADPLPAGWTYAMGLKPGPMKIAAIRNEKSTALVTFIEIPNAEHKTAEQLLSDPSTHRQLGNGSQFNVESHGTDTIGGKQAYYVRGKSTGSHGDSAFEMSGIILSNGDALIIQSMEPKATSFDPAMVAPIKSAITGFAG